MNRTLRLLVLLCLQIALVFSPFTVAAADAITVAKNLPRTFSGQYQWRNTAIIHKVTFNFSDIRVMKSGNLEAVGTGKFGDEGKITKVKLRAVIDPSTLKIELWESAPTTANFVTDGSHKGQLSPDLHKLDAVWTTASTQQKGDLTLAGTKN